MNVRKVLLAAVVAATSFDGLSSQAATIVGNTTLDILLIPGNVYQVGDLVFDFNELAFSSTKTGPGFGFAPQPADIAVSPFTSVPGSPGMFFQASWQATGIGGTPTSVDTHFEFSVTTLSGRLIKDDYLATTGSATPEASWFVHETVTTTIGADLVNFKVASTLGNSQLVTQSAVFTPQPSIYVKKDINLLALLNNPIATSSISDIAQGFSTVPLPAATWGGLTLLGLLGAARIRRHIRE